MKNSLRTLGNEITHLLCSFAIILISFTHTASATSQPTYNTEAELAVYSLPNGAVLEICTNNGALDEKGGLSSQCEFCRIAGAFLQEPDVCNLVQLRFYELLSPSFGVQIQPLNSIQLSSRSLRGPPNA